MRRASGDDGKVRRDKRGRQTELGQALTDAVPPRTDLRVDAPPLTDAVPPRTDLRVDPHDEASGTVALG